MKDIKTILCPTDFSPASQAALQLATTLAKSFGAKLHLVHIFQLPYYVGWEEGPAMVAATQQMLSDLKVVGDKQLAEAIRSAVREGVETRGELLDGVPHVRISELSKGVELVVMGTHGRTGLPRLLLGSVAERVLRTAHCPVLTVPAEEHAEPAS